MGNIFRRVIVPITLLAVTVLTSALIIESSTLFEAFASHKIYSKAVVRSLSEGKGRHCPQHVCKQWELQSESSDTFPRALSSWLCKVLHHLFE